MAKNWMAGVTRTMKKGALRATAKRRGLISDGEKLSMEDIEELKRSKDPRTRRRATLAQTFMRSRHG
jgi:hypothetical protein